MLSLSLFHYFVLFVVPVVCGCRMSAFVFVVSNSEIVAYIQCSQGSNFVKFLDGCVDVVCVTCVCVDNG